MIERKVTLSAEDLLYEPILSVCEWKENHWNSRLVNCIKHTYPHPDKIQLTAHSGVDFSTELSDRVYIFYGAPHTLIRRTKHVATTIAGTSDSSSEDESATEACLQRSILKSKGNLLLEKLGEPIALSYILLACKIFRRIHKQRPMKEVTVNGLLLDKILGVVHYEVIGNVSGPQDAQKSLQVSS